MIRSLTFRPLVPVFLFSLAFTAPTTAQTLKAFTNGQVADATAVNENFTAVKNAAAAADTKATSATTKADAAQAASTALSGLVTPLLDVIKVVAGKVGIGTATPAAQLEVAANDDTGVIATAYGTDKEAGFLGRVAGGTQSAPAATPSGTVLGSFNAAGHTGTAFTDPQAYINMEATQLWSPTAHGTRMTFATTPNGSTQEAERMVIADNGRVGIGTANPTRAKVEIVGASGSYSYGQRGFLTSTNQAFGSNTGTYTGVGLYVAEDIWGGNLFAFSDARMKRVEGRSDSARDLRTLLGIEVTDYTHIDTVTKGAGKQKKVIAQQVERVFPQAVSRTTEVIPDIYERAEVRDGWVKLATDLQKGDRVRLIGNHTEGIHEVLEATQDGFRTDFVADGDEVFVFGREVNDFRSVDYNAIAMLDVSATQELARQLGAKDAEIAALRARLADLEAIDGDREARLARLEQALEVRQPQMAGRSQGSK